MVILARKLLEKIIRRSDIDRNHFTKGQRSGFFGQIYAVNLQAMYNVDLMKHAASEYIKYYDHIL